MAHAQQNRTYAQLNNGVVILFFTIDQLPEWNDEHLHVVDVTDVVPAPGIGWVFNGGSFTPPVPPVPPVVSPFQARAALLQAGLLDDVEAYMALPSTDPMEKLAWDRATEFRRHSPSIEAMKRLLGVSDSQLDDLFRFASSISA